MGRRWPADPDHLAEWRHSRQVLQRLRSDHRRAR
nr:hypothetical protein [Pseudomonas allokribbensis]